MNWRKFSPALLTLLVFLLAQGIGALLMLLYGMNPGYMPVTAFSLILMAVDILAVLGCYFILRYIRLYAVADISSIHWRTGLIGIVAGILGAIAISILTEKVPLPDFMEQMSIEMSRNIWGLITLVIIGPISEELIFREAIEGEMLRRNASPWAAIIVSALAFSIAHYYLAQGLYALPLAILFGIIYYKTGNIILTSLLHILNNGIAALQLSALGEGAKDFSYAEWLGGPTHAYTLMLFCGVLSIALMRVFWNNYPADEKAQKKASLE